MHENVTVITARCIARATLLASVLLGGVTLAETNSVGPLDGTFETALPTGAASGDAARVSNIGTVFPSEGTQALLMTTEPDSGSTPVDVDESALVISSFTIPAGYATLRLDYDYLTDEPAPSLANDTFEVKLVLVTVGGEEILLASDTFSTFFPAPWTGYDAQTGYRSMIGDIAATAGTGDLVTLELRIADVGDGRRNSAVLVDNVRLVEPGAPEVVLPQTFFEISPGEEIIFDGTGSVDDVGITEFEWDFGNGFFGFGPVIAMDQYTEPGFYQGTFTVEDADGNTDTAPFVVQVGPINSGPAIISLPVTTASEGLTYSYQVVAADDQVQFGDVLLYALPVAPAGMSIDPDTGLVSWPVPVGADLQNSVTVSVTDGEGESDSQSFTVTLGPEVYIAVAADDSRFWTARSIGDGTFGPLEFVDDMGNRTRGIAVADFDSDDDYDVISSYRDGSSVGHLFLYPRVGAGFDAPTYLGPISGVGGYIEDMAAEDFNNDGRMDLVVQGDNSSVWLLEATGPLVTEADNFYAATFETGNDGWGGASEVTWGRDDSTAASGMWSMLMTPTNDASRFQLDVNPSNWFLSRGSTLRFAYRMAPGTPVTLRFNVSGFGWVVLGASAAGDGSTAPVSPESVVLVDDDTWRTVEIDVYGAIRAVWPTASQITEFEFWTDNNASLSAGHHMWFDDFYITRPRMVSGFTTRALPSSGTNSRGVDAADANLDGDMDFARGRTSSGYIHLYAGDGDGDFTVSGSQVADPGNDPYGVLLGDFDGNGVPDIIANNNGSGDPYFFRGVGNGTFDGGIYIPSLDTNNYTSYGKYDFNGDGNLDVVSSNYTSRTVRAHPGLGDGTFGAATQIGTTSGNMLAVAAPAGRVPGQPFALATQDATDINEGDSVSFDASDSYDNGNVVDYAWDFGDGTTGNGQTISHPYTAEGNYDVVLTVTDNEGNIDRFNLQVRVNGSPPVSDAGGPYTLGETAALLGRWRGTLDGRGSSDAETSIARYEWDFDASDGVGIDATGPLPRATFDAAGTYTVTLTVYDEVDQPATTTTTVTVQAGATPVAALTGPAALGEDNASLGVYTGDYGAGGSTDDSGLATLEIAWDDGSTTTRSSMADDFDDGNFNGWSVNGGTWSVSGGELAQTQLGAAWRWLQDRSRKYRDFQLEVDFKGISSSPDGYMGIVFRNSNGAGSTDSFLMYSRNSWDFWRFYDWNTSTTLVEGGTGWDANVWYHLRLVVVGDTMQLYATPEGGVETLQIEFTSGAHAFGGIGLLANDQNLRYDNVKVTPLDAGWEQSGNTVDDLLHTFALDGTYDVTLTVTDHAGQTDSTTVTTTAAPGLPPTADTGGPYLLNEADATDGRWDFIMDASGSVDDVNVERYTVDFGDGTSYTTGLSHGRRGSYFATGTDLYGFDTANGTLQRIVATEDGTFIELINLADNTVLASTTLNRFQTWNNVSAGDGAYFKVKATKPVVAYFTNLGAHSAFVPSIDGGPVGKEFIYYHDLNNGFYIYAYEDALVSMYATNGTLVESYLLRAGEYTSSPSSNVVRRVVSSGRIAMQTSGNNGYTAVPSETGDGAGRLFYFATRSGTGSVAVFAHEAANIEVFDLDSGASLYTGSISAGDMWYQNGVGTRRLRLVSDADVEVWGGDTEGGTGILDLGDDVSFSGGRNGTEFVLHNLRDGIVIFAPNDGTEVTVDGAVVATLDLDQYLHLAPSDFVSGSGVHIITTTQPVVIQTLGRANVFNDLGTYLGGVSMRHQYLTTGTYTVMLTATDNAGQTDTATTTVEVVANDPPAADISAPDVADETFANGGIWFVDFDAGGSTDDFGIASYDWDFGDGANGSGAQVTHGYTATGSYDVTLTVTDHAGQSVTVSRQIEVTLGAGPTAVTGGPYVFGEESASYGIWTATLDGTGSTDDAGIFDYLWELPPLLEDDFEDGVTPEGDWLVGSNTTEAGGTLSITGAGNWTAQGIRLARGALERHPGVEITGRVQGTGRIMFGVYREGASDFNYPSMPHAIHFNNGSLGIYENGSNRGGVGSYVQGTQYDVRIVLKEVGADYFIRQTGTNDWTPLTGYSPRNLSDQSLLMGATVLSGTWSFDDFSTGPHLLAGPVVTREYYEPTVIPVSLTVRDNALQADTDSSTITIELGAPPVADPAGPYTVEVGTLLSFNGTGSTDDTAIQSHDWVFGDTTGGPAATGTMTADLPYTGSGATPRHFYQEVGTYDVELTVTDNVGQTHNATTTVEVVVGGSPTAAASVSSSAGVNGPPAYFDARASIDDFGIVEYRWDFDDEVDRDGDGNTTNDIDAVGATPYQYYSQATPAEGTLFSEDFEGVALDSSIWNSVGGTQSGGVATVTGAGSWGNRYLSSVETFDRSRISLRGEILPPAGTTYVMWGFKNTSTSQSYNQMPHALYFHTSGLIYIYEDGSNRGSVASYTKGQWYDVRIDLKEAGADYYFRPAGSASWTLINPSNPLNRTTTPLRIHSVVNSGDVQHDNITVEGIGPYVATLTVEDGAGQTSTSQVEVEVALNAPPDVITVPWVAFDPLAPHETYNGKEIRLKGIVRDADPATYRWDFGDGTSTGEIPVTNSYDLSVAHTYPNAPSGTPFTATLTVTDSAGNTGSDTYPVVVRPLNLTTEINIAIDEGLWYLHQTQTRSTAEGYDTGYWTSNARASATSSALQAFQVNGHLESVRHEDDPYAETVMRGLRQLFRDLSTVSIATQTYGEPDSNGNGLGIQTGAVSGSGGLPIYQGGQVMDAIASSGNPLARTVTGSTGINRRRYFDILTDMTDQFAWGQTEQGNGGGWRYQWNNSIDQSAAQWGAIGVVAAEDTFGIPVPQWVKERNLVWLDRSFGGQGWGYTIGGVTRAGTPSGLVQMVLDDRIRRDRKWGLAERWIADNWTSQYIINAGNRPYYPYYAMTKAMRLAKPKAVDTFYNGFDWFRDETLGLARTLIDDQNANGSFPGAEFIRDQLRSAWGVIILSRSLFVQPPVADAGRDLVWGVDLELTLDGSNSFHLDPFRDIVLYEWDFDGDGTFDFSNTEPFATHTYLESDYPEPTLPQTLTVRLRVTDNNSPALTDTDTAEIIIAIPPHPPVAEAGGPYTCTAGLPCELDGTGSLDIDPTDFIARYEWDLDGFPFDYGGATGPNPTPVFSEGLHDIGLRVWDNGVLNDLDGDGELDEDERLSDVDFAIVTAVFNEPPNADANGPYTVEEGSGVVLDGSGSTDPNGDPLDFAWDLDNDGTFDDAIGLAPTFLGVDDGDYPVTLKVTDTLLDGFAGSTVTVTNVPPTVDAGPDDAVDEGNALSFSGSFTDPGTLDTHTFEWDFGDSNVQTGTLTPTHTYLADGVYTVTLTVTDDDGGIGIDTLTVTVADSVPTAILTGVQTLPEGAGGTYDASGSISPADDIVSYEWDFAYDGTFDPSGTTGAIVTYGLPDDGAFTVAVRVTDEDGSESIAALPVVVVNVPPVVDAGPDASIDEGQTFTQTGSFTDPGTDTWTATVDYGEGAGPVPLTLNADKTFDLSNTYMDDGVYTVTVTVTDDDGGSSSDSVVVTVNDLAPTAVLSGDETLFEGDTGAYDASASSSSPDAIVSFEWDFDYDGVTFTPSVASGVTATHLFPDDGVFTVAVRVTDDDGSTSISTLGVTVSNVPPAVDVGPDAFIDEGESFARLGSFVDPGSDTWTATVDYDDGLGPQPLSLNPDKTFDLLQTYPDNGVYTVTLIVTDDDGGIGSESLTVTVADLAPTAVLTGDTALNEGSTGAYDASGSTSPVDAIVSYEWDFDYDGVTFTSSGASGVTATHSFPDDGTFTVAVRVTDDDGSTSIAALTVDVANVAPLVEAGDDVSVDEGTLLPFSGAFTDPGTLDTHTFAWDFGDGNFATGSLTASHTYQDDGVYTATLTVTDDDSGVGIDTLTVTVNDLAPTAALTGDATLIEGDTGAYDASASTSPVDAIVSYEWDFDYDGVTFTPSGASGATATQLFPDNGTFTVAVRVTDDDGSTSIATLPVTVANAAPVVDAGADATIDEGQTFSQGGSFTDPGADTWTATVDYGEGVGPEPLALNADNTFDLSHTYLDNGVYTVTVTVTDSDGGVGIDTLTVTVNDLAPTAALSGDTTLIEGDTGAYDASASTSPVDAIVSYEWDFDYDGVTFTPSGASGATATQLFPDNGTFTVAVRVTDDDGSTSIATLPVTVANAAPVVDAGADATIDEGQTFSQGGSFTDPGADTWTATVDYGEGVGPEPLALNADNTFDLSHTYLDNGVYTVTVTVTDSDGGVGIDTLTVTVNDLAPTAALSGDTTLIEGDTGAYDASASTSPVDAIVSYEWDFDYDGVTFTPSGASGATATQLFPDNGTFTVAVRVTDDDGSTSIATLPVTVANAAPVVDAGADATIDEGQTFSQGGSFTDPGADTWTATVDYGEGVGPEPLALNADNTFDLSHTYLDNGVYTVTVTVTDSDGGVGIDTLTVTVNDLAPTAALSGDTTLIEGDTGAYDASASTSPVDAIVSYEWDFDYDGVTFTPSGASGATATQLFPDNGTFTVAVRVTDDDGSTSIATLPVTVANAAPVVDAGADATIDEGQTFSQGGSFTDPGADTWTATVDYGEGVGPEPLALNADNTFDLSHTYLDNGVYTVTVTVTDSDGGVGIDTLTVTVNDLAPTAALSGDTTLIEGDTGAYDASASTSPVDAIVSYEWDFDYDGVTFTPSGASGATATQLFPDNGTFTVAVRVTDDDGSTSIATLPVTVANAAPVVDAGADATIDEGQTFSQGGSFTDPGADTWTATVDYGEGVGPEPLALNADNTFDLSHTYLDNGVYTVTVTVTDSDGGVGIDTLTVTVNDLAPTAALSGDTTLIEGDTGAYDASASTSPVDAIVSYEWDFDYDGVMFTPSGASGATATQLFPDNGTFTVAVRVTDDDGSTSIATLPVTVANAAPVVDAGADATIDEGQTFSQGGSFTDPGADTWTATVDYGEGAGPEPLALNADNTFDLSHTYPSNGVFTIVVTVADDDGGVGSDTVVLTVSAGDGGICPCEADWKNHGKYVVCVVRTTRDLVRQGLLTRSERGQIIAEAGRSSCGKPPNAGGPGDDHDDKKSKKSDKEKSKKSDKEESGESDDS